MTLEPRRQAGDDKDTLIDALAVAWRFPAGALTVIGGAIGLPTLAQRPDLVAQIGLVVGLGMVVVGVIMALVVLFERKRHSRTRSGGVVLGSLTLLPMGLFLAGMMPGLPTPRQVSHSIASPGEPARPASEPTRRAAQGDLRLTVRSEGDAEGFAAALRRRIPQALEGRRIGANAREVTVAATASGRWADPAARLYLGRLDVRMRAEGGDGVCEFTLSSTGRQTVEVAAGQVADQLAPRITALMEGSEQC